MIMGWTMIDVVLRWCLRKSIYATKGCRIELTEWTMFCRRERYGWNKKSNQRSIRWLSLTHGELTFEVPDFGKRLPPRLA